MSDYRNITTIAGDQWVAALKRAEDAVSSIARGARSGATASLDLPGPLARLAEQIPAPSEVVRANFDLTQRILGAQRDLLVRVLQVPGRPSASVKDQVEATEPRAPKEAPVAQPVVEKVPAAEKTSASGPAAKKAPVAKKAAAAKPAAKRAPAAKPAVKTAAKRASATPGAATN